MPQNNHFKGKVVIYFQTNLKIKEIKNIKTLHSICQIAKNGACLRKFHLLLNCYLTVIKILKRFFGTSYTLGN